ncbi:O-antigen ligase family protein [Chitinophaga caseinilytica]|uniref:O-antigen ligase family protein n=1 Tax=Chitinophaga caseinilytica TaxID=2267521 RepID=A0ABZ2Z161_9BACT
MNRKLIVALELGYVASVFILCMWYALYKYTFSFNYQQIPEGGHYLALPVIAGSTALSAAYAAIRHAKSRFMPVDGLVMLALVVFGALLATGSGWYNLHNEVWVNTFCALSIYLFLRLGGPFAFRKVVIPIILLFFLLELCVGYAMLFINFGAERLPLLITGHLENSGLYAIYLVLHFPLVHYWASVNIKSGRAKLGLQAVVIAAASVLVLIVQSRAAMIGAACYGILLLMDVPFCRKHRKKILLASAVVLLLLAAGLIFLKPGSAFGRFIIWKISLGHWQEYIWTGIGYGRFPVAYPSWQIGYFESLPVSAISEVLSADEVYVAYNEPLQWLTETGLPGLVVLLYGIWRLLSHQHERQADLPRQLQSTLLILLATSLFSYPLHVNAILILVSAIMAGLAPLTFRKYKLPGLRWGKICLAALLLAVTIISTDTYRVVKHWNGLQEDITITEKERVAAYDRLYPVLKYNPHFLLDYGILLLSQQDERAVGILEESKSRLITVAVLNALTQAYESRGNMQAAISNAAALACFVPYKFTYRKNLMDLYLKAGFPEKARETARSIIAMPVKKDDETVVNIKRVAGSLLE